MDAMESIEKLRNVRMNDWAGSDVCLGETCNSTHLDAIASDLEKKNAPGCEECKAELKRQVECKMMGFKAGDVIFVKYLDEIIDSMTELALKYKAGDGVWWKGKYNEASPQRAKIVSLNPSYGDYAIKLYSNSSEWYVSEDSLMPIEDEPPDDTGLDVVLKLTDLIHAEIRNLPNSLGVTASMKAKLRQLYAKPADKPDEFKVGEFVCFKTDKQHMVYKIKASQGDKSEVWVENQATKEEFDTAKKNLRLATDKDWEMEIDRDKYFASIDKEGGIIVKVNGVLIILLNVPIYTPSHTKFMKEFCKRYGIPIKSAKEE